MGLHPTIPFVTTFQEIAQTAPCQSANQTLSYVPSVGKHFLRINPYHLSFKPANQFKQNGTPSLKADALLNYRLRRLKPDNKFIIN